MVNPAADKGKTNGRPASRTRLSRAAPVGAVQSRVAYSVGRLERAVRRRLTEVTRRFGLTVAQYTALSVLHARGPLSNAQLARRSFVSPQAMNEILQAMAATELVGREPHARHGRIVQISLTPKGSRVLRRCDAQVERIESGMLERLSRAQRTQFREFLRTCIEELEGRGHPARRGGA